MEVTIKNNDLEHDFKLRACHQSLIKDLKKLWSGSCALKLQHQRRKNMLKLTGDITIFNIKYAAQIIGDLTKYAVINNIWVKTGISGDILTIVVDLRSICPEDEDNIFRIFEALILKDGA